MNYDFSTIVLCYHPDMKKLKQTLASIVMQEGIRHEIIIADDGTGEDYGPELEAWFAARKFSDYKLVMNPQNGGTVKNLYSGLAVAEGTYTKNISPGDYLYDAHTLRAFYEKMTKEQLAVCFCKAAYYSCEEGKVTLYHRQSPVDLSVYRKHNEKKIRRNYFWFRDYALGACFAFERTAAITYTEKILPLTRFAEDTATICMVSAGERIGLLDAYGVWYEYGTGISTASQNKWAKILREENRQVFSMLAQTDPLAKKTYGFHFGKEPKNRYLDTLRKGILYPPYLLFMAKAIGGTSLDPHYVPCDKTTLLAILEECQE